MSAPKKVSPPVVDQVLELDPATIDVSGRVGLFFPEKAEAYAALMARDGQRTPITVRRNGSRAKLPWTLVAGLHRHRGCEIAGLKVRALVVEGDEDALKAAQASENLDRRDLSPLEHSMFVAAVADAAKARLRKLHGGKSQQQVAIEQRWNGGGESEHIRSVKMTERMDKVQFTPVERSDAEAEVAADTLAEAYRWSDATAAACGMGVESLKRSLRIFRIIVEPNRDLMDAIKDHAVAQNASALLAICANGSDPANVRAIVEWLIAHPDAKTADEAMVALELMPSRGGTGAPATGDTKFLNGLQSNLQRLSLNGQRRAADVIAQSIAPTALVAVRDAISARIAAAGGEPPDDAKRGEAQASEMRMALQSALNLIGNLKDGIGVDDDEIEAAHGTVQTVLNAARLGTTVADLNAKGEKA
jgi:ParB-like chromosome segregation protein Spo0J